MIIPFVSHGDGSPVTFPAVKPAAISSNVSRSNMTILREPSREFLMAPAIHQNLLPLLLLSAQHLPATMSSRTISQ